MIKKNFKKLNDRKRLEIVKDLLDKFGIKTSLKRIGDINMRIDAQGKFNQNKIIFSIEFGNDSLSIPRKLLEGFAVTHNRYKISKKKLIPIAILSTLPNKRSEYYRVIDDINKVLKIKIFTLPLDVLEKFVSYKNKFNNQILEKLYISEKEGSDFLKPKK